MIRADAPPIDPDRSSLFLDFDGTLVDIAQTPDGIEIPEDLDRILSEVSRVLDGRLALVSGRTVADISQYLGAIDGPIYGSHGGELRSGGDLIALAEPAEDADRMLKAARAFCAAHDGLTLEAKPLGYAIHFRAAPALDAQVYDFVTAAVERSPGMKVQPAKMAYEVKPHTVGKDAAISDAMARFGWGDTVPWMIGDDVTDEAGFDRVHSLGGAAIKVGPGDTVAAHRMDAPRDVLTLLRALGGMA